MRLKQPLCYGIIAGTGLAFGISSCADGERRVDVEVDIDPSVGSPSQPAPTAQGGRSPNAGRGGSTSNNQQGGTPNNNSSGGTSSSSGGKSASGTGGSGNPSSGGSKNGSSGGVAPIGGSASTTGGNSSAAECGNATREDGEECDDGNQEDNDGCTKSCTFQCLDCACDTCMSEQCSAYDASGAGVPEDLIAGCYEATGSATQGPSLGIAKKTLCGDVVACVRGSGCAQDAESFGYDAEMCYCGVPFAECLEDAVDGKCKETFELAAESSEYAEVMERFSDPGYALGLGVALVRCQSEFCAADCGLKVE